MSEQPFNPTSGQTCRETSGFLFSHPCEQLALYACERCGKPICPQHAVYAAEVSICIQCSKLDPDFKPEKTSGNQHSQYDDATYDPDPYWYVHTHYQNYSWHDHNFNEADESVLIGDDGDDVQWEKDMGAS